MLKMKKSLRWPAILTGFLAVLLLVGAVVGQLPGFTPKAENAAVANVSDKDLQSFVEVNKKMLKLQTETEQQMVKMIEEQGLSVDRYVEIATAENDPKAEPKAAEEERTKVKELSDKMEVIDKEFQAQGVSIIEQQGLTAERYNEIAMNVQNSPESQQRYKELIEKELG